MDAITLLASVTVSLDGLVTGAALAACGGRKNARRNISAVIFTIAVLCAAAYLFAEAFAETLPNANKFGAALLAAVAVYGLVKKEENTIPLRKRRVITLTQAILTGFATGIDGACACVDAALKSAGAEIVFFVTLFHLLFMQTGALALSAGKRTLNEKLCPVLLLTLAAFEFVL